LRRTSPGANPAPCAALDLQRIHRVITRGLAVLRQSCPDFIAAGFHDDATRDGFWKYCQALEANTHGHHLAEDDLFFPFVADRLPEAAVGALERPLPALQLRAEDRAAFISVMPPELTQQLVPIAWKDAWAPMKPFLLP